jgi:hypothetical protein
MATLRASFAGDTFAMRIAVTILVDGAAGLLPDLEALAAVDLGAGFLVSDFFDTAIVECLAFREFTGLRCKSHLQVQS